MSIYDILNKLNIDYCEINHEPVFTVEESKKIKKQIQGCGCKNLFLTDQKNYYIVIVLEDKKVDLKKVKSVLKTTHLSFATLDELNKVLKLSAGSVTPFGIINDIGNKVTILLDNDLKGKTLLFHPNTNTKTISITYDNLIKFIEFENHNYMEI